MGAFIVHRLRYILGWYISASAVFRRSSKYFGNSSSSRVRVYYIMAGTLPDGRCHYRELLDRAFPAGHDDEIKDKIISKLLAQGKNMGRIHEEDQIVTGKVHCEAALMALAATGQTGEQLGLDENKLQMIKVFIFFSVRYL
jgi:hypothetical protein